MAIELTNGKQQKEQLMAFEIRSRIFPITPDFSQWEVKLHIETDLGMGKEIIAELSFRSFNGGIAPLQGALPDAFKAAKDMLQKAATLLAQMQKQAESQIVPATQMPRERGQ